jgi:hypothetical protein
MYKLFHQVTSFGAKDTAMQILYLCRDKNAMRTDLNIRDFYAVRDTLASVIENGIDHNDFRQLPSQTQEKIIGDIADKLVEVANSHEGTHPQTSFDTATQATGNGIGYETKITGITGDMLFGSDTPHKPGVDRPGVEHVAISFSPTLFNNQELQKQLQETFQQIKGIIAASKDQKSSIPEPVPPTRG